MLDQQTLKSLSGVEDTVNTTNNGQMLTKLRLETISLRQENSSVDDFKEAFKHYTVTYLHDDWNNSFIEKR